MRKKLLLFLTIHFCFLQIFALNSPDLRCVSVANNGDVTLQWLAPTDLNNFAAYEIYRSTSMTGTYMLVGTSTNPADVSFLHTGAGAHVQNYYYYVQTISTTDRYPSRILSTIDFYLTNPGNGLAILTWSPPVQPLLPTYSPTYDIYREYPGGTWNPISSTSELRYSDTITMCDNMIGYRVELKDASGCKNISRVNRDQFMDKIGPAIPVLDSVSVNFNTDEVVLGWEASTSGDTYAYVVYLQENGVWIPIDTCYGRNNTFYKDTGHSPPGGVQKYRIAALDSCLNSSPMSVLQSTMHLICSSDTCRRSATLNWTSYENMLHDVGKYLIYYTIDNGSLQYAGETDANTPTYTFSGLIPDKNYCFIVKAINTTGIIKATSSRVCFTFTVADNKDFAYIRYVTVKDNQYVEVKVFTGETISFDKVNLYRSHNDSTDFTLVGTLKNNGTDTYVFQDKNAKTDRAVYYYQAAIENNCQAETAKSNVSHNILLKGVADNEKRMNNLEWVSYEKWENGVGYYTVFRKLENSRNFLYAGDTPSLINIFEDDVSDINTSGAAFTYFVEAEESGVNKYGFTDTCRSNHVIIKQTPLLYVPNAFRPEGNVNTVFKPVNSFVSYKDYSFQIYSRFGMLVFSTTDPNEGWNGGMNGVLVEMGVYVYKIKYIDDQDILYEQTGYVTLVR